MLAKAFATLLIENKTTLTSVEDALKRFHLTSLLPSILDELKHHQKEITISETIHIESPFPISKENESTIKKLLNAEDKNHHFIENKNLLAGFRARYKGTMVDSSMERILATFINQ
jgi:F0F1-type ATP synthase delta subunit